MRLVEAVGAEDWTPNIFRDGAQSTTWTWRVLSTRADRSQSHMVWFLLFRSPQVMLDEDWKNLSKLYSPFIRSWSTEKVLDRELVLGIASTGLAFELRACEPSGLVVLVRGAKRVTNFWSKSSRSLKTCPHRVFLVYFVLLDLDTYRFRVPFPFLLLRYNGRSENVLGHFLSCTKEGY